MDRALDQLVRTRAGGRCEYCLRPQSTSPIVFPIDHIIARQHRGPTTADNLALCCGRCNLAKGPNIAGLDPLTNSLTRLFNPRLDRWSEHFALDGPTIRGLTDIGRTTMELLDLNNPKQIGIRRLFLPMIEPTA
jgi:hypothetical protein